MNARPDNVKNLTLTPASQATVKPLQAFIKAFPRSVFVATSIKGSIRTIIVKNKNHSILVPPIFISYYWVDTSCVSINNWIPETH